MRSVADDLRDATRRRLATMSAAERLRLALSLGDADVTCYAAANDIAPAEARRRLRAGRQIGRRPSVCSEAR